MTLPTSIRRHLRWSVQQSMPARRMLRRWAPWLLVGVAAGAGLAAGLAYSARQHAARRAGTSTDAPPWTVRGGARDPGPLVTGRTVTIAQARPYLYAFWRDMVRLPEIMDEVAEVVPLDGDTARWTRTVDASGPRWRTSRLIEAMPDTRLAWMFEDEPDEVFSVRFADAPGGRGTWVTFTHSSRPGFGAVGRTVARLRWQGPGGMLRRTLRRFKQLVETGAVTTSASPSARRGESPAVQTL